MSDSVIRGSGRTAPDRVRTASANRGRHAGARSRSNGNLIADNRNDSDPASAAGVRFLNAPAGCARQRQRHPGQRLRRVRRTDPTRAASPRSAAGEHRRQEQLVGRSRRPVGGRRACPCVLPPTPRLAEHGDWVTSNVDASDFRHRARRRPGRARAPARRPAGDQPCRPPTAPRPSPGSTVPSARPPRTTSTSRRCEFLRGTTPVGRRTRRRRTQPASPRPAAGPSQAITVIAFDSAGQTGHRRPSASAAPRPSSSNSSPAADPSGARRARGPAAGGCDNGAGRGHGDRPGRVAAHHGGRR